MTEKQIARFAQDSLLMRPVSALHQVLNTYPEFSKLSKEDFLALVLLSPAIGVMLADGEINMFESYFLKFKARSASKGGLFHLKDPVVKASRTYIRNHDKLHESFYETLKRFVDGLNYKDEVDVLTPMIEAANIEKDGRTSTRTMTKASYQRIIAITKDLELDGQDSFKQFLEDYVYLAE